MRKAAKAKDEEDKQKAIEKEQEEQKIAQEKAKAERRLKKEEEERQQLEEERRKNDNVRYSRMDSKSISIRFGIMFLVNSNIYDSYASINVKRMGEQ